jgi:hypothetical protein
MPTRKGIGKIVFLSLALLGLTGSIAAPAGYTSSRNRDRNSILNNRNSAISTKSENVDQQAHINEVYGKLPISFELNRGQANREVKYVSRGAGYSLFLTPTEARLALRNSKSETSLSMLFNGANSSPQIEGSDELEGKSNYFSGKDSNDWHKRIGHYTKVRYRDLYPGIDMIFYGNQQNIEYDFIVAPGMDTRIIDLVFKGAQSIKIDNGDLLLGVNGGEIRQHRPISYQIIDGKTRFVEGEYLLKDRNRVGFKLGVYDRSRELFIDPILSYSTYLGGGLLETGNDIAVDKEGNVYVTGLTFSSNFPIAGPVQSEPAKDVEGRPTPDIFVTKLAPGGDRLIYSTYLGGNDYDTSSSIAVDSEGNAYITGYTRSTNFPTASAIQGEKKGFGDSIFVTKINTAGDSLLFSTYLGGEALLESSYCSIAVDSSGCAYVAGIADEDFPVTEGAFKKTGRGPFIAKLNPTGSALEYSTRFDGLIRSIAVDSEGNAYLTGQTNSDTFPTVNPFQARFSHASDGGYSTYSDAFVTKLNATGSGLVYSTYLGGEDSSDVGEDIAVDGAGNAYVTGMGSLKFPTTPGSFKYRGTGGFTAKLSPSGSSLIYSTRDIGGRSLAIDADGYAYLIGVTSDTVNIPVVNSIQTAVRGRLDIYVAKLNKNGTALIYSTVLGGSDEDIGYGIAVDEEGNAYVVGETRSTDFPLLNPFQSALQDLPPNFGGTPIDNFIVKISDPDRNPPSIALLGPKEGESVPRRYPIRFTGEDADGLSGYILAYSQDRGNTFRDIARVPADKNEVLWNMPERVSSYTHIKLTAVDRFGNTSSIISDYFHADALPYSYRPATMAVTFKLEPSSNPLAPPRVKGIETMQVIEDEYPATYYPKPSIAQPTLAGYNFYRVPYPEDGRPVPTAAEIVNPENLVGSVSAGSSVYTDAILVYGGQFNGNKLGEDLPGNYIYSVTSVAGDGRESAGSEPIITGVPAIIKPDFRDGTIFMQAQGSLITKGARLLINQRYSYRLVLDETRSFYTVRKDRPSSGGNLLIQQAIKKRGAVELMVVNPNGKSSLRIIFSRGYF